MTEPTDDLNTDHRRTRAALMRTLTALEPPKTNPVNMTNAELAEAVELELLVSDWMATYDGLDEAQRRTVVRGTLKRAKR